MEHLNLDLLRQGGGEALNIQLLGIQPHGFNEQLVALLVWEPLHLGFNRRAVAGTDALNGAVIERGAVQIGPDHRMSSLIGVGEIAYSPVFQMVVRPEGKGLGVPVPLLKLHFRKIHRTAVDPWGRTRLESTD